MSYKLFLKYRFIVGIICLSIFFLSRFLIPDKNNFESKLPLNDKKADAIKSVLEVLYISKKENTISILNQDFDTSYINLNDILRLKEIICFDFRIDAVDSISYKVNCEFSDIELKINSDNRIYSINITKHIKLSNDSSKIISIKL